MPTPGARARVGEGQPRPAPPRPAVREGKPRPRAGARRLAEAGPRINSALGRGGHQTTTRLADCSFYPRTKRDMAAAKPENLSLVVHGPGDLRLVKREWGLGSLVLLHWPRCPLGSSSPAPDPAHILAGYHVGGRERMSSVVWCQGAAGRVLVACLLEPSLRPARGWRPGRFPAEWLKRSPCFSSR